MFALVVDDFGVEYVGEKYLKHLIDTLEEHHEITEIWTGNKFLRINLEWNKNKSCNFSMRNCIMAVLQQFQHKLPKRPRHSPAPHQTLTYGATRDMLPIRTNLNY